MITTDTFQLCESCLYRRGDYCHKSPPSAVAGFPKVRSFHTLSNAKMGCYEGKPKPTEDKKADDASVRH